MGSIWTCLVLLTVFGIIRKLLKKVLRVNTQMFKFFTLRSTACLHPAHTVPFVSTGYAVKCLSISYYRIYNMRYLNAQYIIDHNQYYRVSSFLPSKGASSCNFCVSLCPPLHVRIVSFPINCFNNVSVKCFTYNSKYFFVLQILVTIWY